MRHTPPSVPVFLIFVAVLAVCAPFAEAKGIEDSVLKNPAGVGEMVINITQSGTIVSNGNPTRIVININIPQDDDRLDTSMVVQTKKDEFGTDIGVIDQADPGNRFSYMISGIIRSRANHLVSLPSSYVIPEEAKVYLQSTENIQSSDPSIRNLALDISKDSRDDFERVAKLAMWVNDHLDYDLSYTGKNLDALSVLSQRRGVCSEYTTLFVAFARSIGIPAKFVSGYSYGERGWERHAYSEVYLGKWVPVDPLWLEIGYLDATHIKFGNHLDSYVKNDVEVTGYNVNSIDWTEDSVNLSTISFQPAGKQDDYQISISGDMFRRGDEGVVAITIVPAEFVVGKLILEPCAGDYSIVDVTDKAKNVILRPGETGQVYWKIKMNADLPRNMLFTCPLTLNSRSLSMKTVDAIVNTQYAARTGASLSARLSSSVVELGDEQKVYIGISGMASPARVGVIAGDVKEEWDIAGSDFNTVFSFRPEDLGENEVVVYTSEGDVASLDYSVSSHLSVSMENVTVPAYMKTGERKNVSAYVVNSGASEESVHAGISVDGAESLANFMLKSRYLISLPVSFTTPGLKTVRFGIAVAGMNLSETRVIEVFEQPAIFYETDYSDGKALLKLNVKNSKIRNATIRVGSEASSIDEAFGSKTFAYSIPQGEYPLEIVCYDMAGNPYKTSATIEFREKNFLEKILDMINGFIQSITSVFGALGSNQNIGLKS
jgi:hypothetical protein